VLESALDVLLVPAKPLMPSQRLIVVYTLDRAEVPVSLLAGILSSGGLSSTVEQGRSLERLVPSRIIDTCMTVTFSAFRGFAAPAMLQKPRIEPSSPT
jgi:hypothetical protein